MEVCFGIII